MARRKPNIQKADNGGDERDEAGRFVPGKAGGPGRPVGSPNKFGSQVKADVVAAYEKRGGVKWLASLPDVIFVGLLGKLLPREAPPKADNQRLAPVTVQGDVVVMLQAMIEGVAAAVPAGSHCFTAPAGALPGGYPGQVGDVEGEECGPGPVSRR